MTREKEEAITRLSDIRADYSCFDDDERPKYHALSMAIEALQDDWIPVSERLPEKSKQVMCCDKQGRVFTSAMTHINSNGEPSFGKHYGVIAWKPLPTPYKGV